MTDRELAGILLIDKPAGPSSHDAVATARRALDTRRVGHFGTLDPFASGLLVCGVGGATRLAPFCVGHDKVYEAVVRLGWRSTTDDPEGDLTKVPDARPPSVEAVEAACQQWTGSVSQVPPVFSAVHVGGKRAYARARAGEEVELKPRIVRVHKIEIQEFAYPDLQMKVVCGPGTYIRSLARDLGDALSTGAFCAMLRRIESGPFSVSQAVGWDDLTTTEISGRALLPAAAALQGMSAVTVDDTQCEALVHGRTIQAAEDTSEGDRWIQIHGPNGLVGIAERVEDDGAVKLKPKRILFPLGEGSLVGS